MNTSGNVTGGSDGGTFPGLVFDNRAATNFPAPGFNQEPGASADGSGFTGFPFTVGSASGNLLVTDASAAFSHPPTDIPPAPAPAAATTGRFATLALTFAPGKFTGGSAINFGVDLDEWHSPFRFQQATYDRRNGSTADDLGNGVEIPSGNIVPGGMSFSGMLFGGQTFSGIMTNRIGAGWSFLDGFGFINAQSAVALPLP
jgi:hypothetical protein